MKKISSELENTRKSFSFFSRLKRNSPVDNGLWNEIEEALIQADVGVTATTRMIDVLQMKSKELRLSTTESILDLLKEQLKNSLQKFNAELDLGGIPPFGFLSVLMVLGKPRQSQKLRTGNPMRMKE